MKDLAPKLNVEVLLENQGAVFAACGKVAQSRGMDRKTWVATFTEGERKAQVRAYLVALGAKGVVA